MTPEEHVLDHYSKPRHQNALLSDPSLPDSDPSILYGNAVSDVCKDSVSFEARVGNGDGRISEIGWYGHGCCFSQAAASMLAEYALDKTVAEMKIFADYDMFELFQADCPIAREGCVLVSLQALRHLLEIV